jgi:hypothetical protein
MKSPKTSPLRIAIKAQTGIEGFDEITHGRL